MKPRRKIKKITIEMEGEKNKVYDIANGDELPEALFFGEKGVKKILTPFYEKEPKHTVKKVDVEKEWGKNITNKVFGSENEKTITDSLINDLWTTPDDDGLLRAVIRKKPQCPLE